MVTACRDRKLHEDHTGSRRIRFDRKAIRRTCIATDGRTDECDGGRSRLLSRDVLSCPGRMHELVVAAYVVLAVIKQDQPKPRSLLLRIGP